MSHWLLRKQCILIGRKFPQFWPRRLAEQQADHTLPTSEQHVDAVLPNAAISSESQEQVQPVLTDAAASPASREQVHSILLGAAVPAWASEEDMDPVPSITVIPPASEEQVDTVPSGAAVPLASEEDMDPVPSDTVIPQASEEQVHTVLPGAADPAASKEHMDPVPCSAAASEEELENVMLASEEQEANNAKHTATVTPEQQKAAPFRNINGLSALEHQAAAVPSDAPSPTGSEQQDHTRWTGPTQHEAAATLVSMCSPILVKAYVCLAQKIARCLLL